MLDKFLIIFNLDKGIALLVLTHAIIVGDALIFSLKNTPILLQKILSLWGFLTPEDLFKILTRKLLFNFI